MIETFFLEVSSEDVLFCFRCEGLGEVSVHADCIPEDAERFWTGVRDEYLVQDLREHIVCVLVGLDVSCDDVWL